MRGFKLTERRLAIVCAIVLITLSVTAAFRQYHNSQPVPEPKSQASSESIDTPSIDGSEHVAVEEPTAVATPPPAPQARPLPQVPTKQDAYTYTAHTGSNYTEFAREAVAAYASTQNVTVSSDQLVAVEVALANNAGQPLLEIGQQVQIASADVSQQLQAAGVIATTSPADKPAPAPSNTEKTTSSKGVTSCTYTAPASSSYTQFARQCVATYSKNQSITLSNAQRVAAETHLSQQANAPQLTINQQLTIEVQTVADSVKRAQSLNVIEQAAWQPYADTIAW